MSNPPLWGASIEEHSRVLYLIERLGGLKEKAVKCILTKVVQRKGWGGRVRSEHQLRRQSPMVFLLVQEGHSPRR